MFKKMVLIGLLSVGGLQAISSEEGPNTLPIKKRHKISRWFKVIIPSILSYVFLEGIIRTHKNNPDSQELVKACKWARWMPLFVVFYCADKWLNGDFKEWALSKTAVPDSAP